MNTLLETTDFLVAALQADPLLRLAHCVAWLDPVWFEADDADGFLPGDGDGTLSAALRITRENFPDLYCEAVEALRNGATYAQIDQLICNDLTDRGLPVDALEFLAFGVPLPAYGVCLEDPEFYCDHPEFVPVLDWFGIAPDPGAYTVAVPESAYTAGWLIAANLAEHANADYQNVGWLVGFLFSCTGNSVSDWDEELMSSVQPLAWDKEEVAFALAIIEEAEAIMRQAKAGLDYLLENAAMQEALQANIRRIFRAVKRQKGNRDEPKVRLKWPSPRHYLDTVSGRSNDPTSSSNSGSNK